MATPATRRRKGATTTRRRGAGSTKSKPQARTQPPPLIQPDRQLVDKLEALGAAVIPPDFATDVTPEMAEMMLRGNARNRHLKPKKIDEYSGALQRGEWEYNGDSVRITTAGKLIDGQHRLISIVQTGVPAKLLVAVIEDDDALKAQATMDTGSRRSFGDMLQIENVTNATAVAAATGIVWAFEQDGVPVMAGRPMATIQQKYDVLDRHPGIHDSVSTTKQNGVLPPSNAAALHYLFATADEEDADEFFRLLRTGDGLEVGDPIHTLRERIFREERSPSGRINPAVRTAFTIIAFNYWRAGNSITKLQFRPGGARPDRFPRIEGLDESRFRFVSPPRGRGGRSRSRRAV